MGSSGLGGRTFVFGANHPVFKVIGNFLGTVWLWSRLRLNLSLEILCELVR